MGEEQKDYCFDERNEGALILFVLAAVGAEMSTVIG